MPDPVAVNTMFARIARRYDLANRVLSAGVDRRWRHRLVAAVQHRQPGDVLDLATGSGDVAFALADTLPLGARITGMDFCQPMLDEAKKKQAVRPDAARISFRLGDGLAIPAPDGSFDAVTISFGLRNMADRHQSLCEMRRVLRPGGSLFVLEFSQPYPWFKPLYLAYLRWLLPVAAGLLTGDRAAYRYLNETIEEFPAAAPLAAEIRAAGFRSVEVHRLTFGIVALHEAQH